MAKINLERPTVDSTEYIIQAVRKFKQRLQVELDDLNMYKVKKKGEDTAEEKAYLEGAKHEVTKFRKFLEDLGV